MATLGERLLQARTEKKWSRQHLAVVADVTVSQIGMLERGERGNSQRGVVSGTLPALAKALGVNYEWLAHGTEPMTPTGPLTLVAQAASQDEQLRLQLDQLEHVLRLIPQEDQLKATFQAMKVLWGFVDAHLAKTGQALPGPQAPPT